MSAAHTPGPWELFSAKCANGEMAIAIKSTKTSACVGFPTGATEEEISANATIQMLAPQMLEVCRFMLANAFERKWAGDEKAFSMLTAIAKSTGSTT